MSRIENELKIDTYFLNSSSDVSATIETITRLKNRDRVIHILSFIHNTVLVQTLKKELQKVFPETTVALVKHQDKTQTMVNVYSLNTQEEDADINAMVLDAMHIDYLSKDESAQKCRNQLFSRYFTDHLTNLPNVYQLRKDIEESTDYGLVLIKIDNFITINNFYGFVIGDYVIEEISKYLKKTISDYKVYRLSGAEFAFTLDESKSFYELKIYLENLYDEIKNYSVDYQNSNIFIDFTSNFIKNFTTFVIIV